MRQIIPLAIMPRPYRTKLKELYGSDFNTLVYRTPSQGKNVEREYFRFNGSTLLDVDKLKTKYGSRFIAEVQRKAWDIFPSKSHGNFLVYVNPEQVKLTSNNCLVYKSPDIKAVKSDGSLFVLSPGSEAINSPGTRYIQSPSCQTFNSPSTTIRNSNLCIVSDSTVAEFIKCLGCVSDKSKQVKLTDCKSIDIEGSELVSGTGVDDSYVLKSKNIKLQEGNNLSIEGVNGLEALECKDSNVKNSSEIKLADSEGLKIADCKKTKLSECTNVGAQLCEALEVLRTSDKPELRKLYNRLIKDNELVLKWYEKMPFIGKAFVPAIG